MTGVFLVDRQEFFNMCTLDFRSGGHAKHVSTFLLTRNTRYDLKIGKQQVAYRAVCHKHPMLRSSRPACLCNLVFLSKLGAGGNTQTDVEHGENTCQQK